MMVSIEMRASCVCPHCNVRNPLPGLRTALDCHSCARAIDLAEILDEDRTGGARYHFGAYYDVLAEAVVLLDEGSPCHDNLSAGNATKMFKRMPRCGVCRSPLPLDALVAAIGGLVACTVCREGVAVRAPDAETRAWDPRLAFVVGDGRGRGTELPASASEGKTVPCDRCGGPLEPDGARRTLLCKSCGVHSFLGDAVWRKLNPTPERLAFFLVYDVDAALELQLFQLLAPGESSHDDTVGSHYGLKGAALDRIRTRVDHAAAGARAAEVAMTLSGTAPIDAPHAQALVGRSDLTAPEACTVDARLDDMTRVGLAVSASLADAFVDLWARSPNVDLRAALVRRPALARHVIAALALDAEPRVRASLASRADLDAGLLETLATDSDAGVRAAIASRGDVPAELLARLREDPAPDVVACVKANPNYEAGFFEKILG